MRLNADAGLPASAPLTSVALWRNLGGFPAGYVEWELEIDAAVFLPSP